MATAEFSKFAGILSTALSQHHLSGFETALLEFHHLHFVPSDAFQGPLDFTFRHKGGVICISEVIDISHVQLFATTSTAAWDFFKCL